MRNNFLILFVVILALSLVVPLTFSQNITQVNDKDTVRQHESGPSEGADNSSEEHGSDVSPILFGLIIILLAAKLGGDLVERFNQPAVLGELIFGMIIGNLALIGFNLFEPLKYHITIEILAEIGVIILLFEVGLESNLREMLSVGFNFVFCCYNRRYRRLFFLAGASRHCSTLNLRFSFMFSSGLLLQRLRLE